MSLVRIIDRKWTSVIVNCLPMMAVFMELNPSSVDFTVWMHFLCLKDICWECIAFSLVLVFSFAVLGQSIWRTLHNKLYEIVIGTFSEMFHTSEWAINCYLLGLPTVWISTIEFSVLFHAFIIMHIYTCIQTYASLIFTSKCLHSMMPH